MTTYENSGLNLPTATHSSDNRTTESNEEVESKNNRGHLRSWDYRNMIKAIKEVQSKNISMMRASKRYKIPRTTLRYYLNDSTMKDSKRAFCLSKAMENVLLEYVILKKCVPESQLYRLMFEKATELSIISAKAGENRKKSPTAAWIRRFVYRHIKLHKLFPTLINKFNHALHVGLKTFSLSKDSVKKLDTQHNSVDKKSVGEKNKSLSTEYKQSSSLGSNSDESDSNITDFCFTSVSNENNPPPLILFEENKEIFPSFSFNHQSEEETPNIVSTRIHVNWHDKNEDSFMYKSNVFTMSSPTSSLQMQDNFSTAPLHTVTEDSLPYTTRYSGSTYKLSPSKPQEETVLKKTRNKIFDSSRSVNLELSKYLHNNASVYEEAQQDFHKIFKKLQLPYDKHSYFASNNESLGYFSFNRKCNKRSKRCQWATNTDCTQEIMPSTIEHLNATLNRDNADDSCNYRDLCTNEHNFQAVEEHSFSTRSTTRQSLDSYVNSITPSQIVFPFNYKKVSLTQQQHHHNNLYLHQQSASERRENHHQHGSSERYNNHQVPNQQNLYYQHLQKESKGYLYYYDNQFHHCFHENLKK